MHHAYTCHSFRTVTWTAGVRLLYECGYDPNVLPFDDSARAGSALWTPLHYAANSAADSGELHAVRALLRRGASLSAQQFNGATAEEFVGGGTLGVYSMSENNYRTDVYALLRDVRLAGGWKRYVNAPRKDMLVLRELCARGRAAPPSALAALFCTTGSGPSRPRTRRNPRVAPLPTPIFWHVLSYWRSDRDFDPSAA